MWLGVIIDIILLVILAIAAYHGYRSGAVKVILSLLIILLIVPIVYLTHEPITDFVIRNTSLHENIKVSVYETLEAKNVNETEKLEDNDEYLPVLTKKINEFINKAKEEKYNNIAEKASEEVANFIMRIIVIIAWSILLYIVLTLVKIILVKIIDTIPFINVVNYVLGSILQVAKVIIIIFVALYLLQFVLPIIKSSVIQDNIEKTNLIKYLYHNNVISKFVK